MIDRTDYIVYGYKIPKTISDKIDMFDDKYLPMVEGHENEEFSLIIDYMSGTCNVFGIILERDDDGWDFVDLNFSNLDAKKVKSKYCELFDLEKSDSLEEPRIFIFTHLS